MTYLKDQSSTTTQIFISYVGSDIVAAKAIVEGLRSRNLDVWLDEYELKAGENWVDSIRNAISASSYFFLLLSKDSVNSPFINTEFISILKELQIRNITLIPILLENCEIPQPLAVYQFFDMRSGIEENLDQLANTLKSASKIDFEKLTPKTFDQLVIDLLKKLGFVNSKLNSQINELGIDAIVEFPQKDPFGSEIREIYLVETKFYRHSRPDLRALRQLVEYTKILSEIDQALLITNGQLTSTAHDWANDATKNTGIPIRIIDGTELKRLLLQNTDLVSQYFTPILSNAS
ncbi:restriction endonuclease [Gloeothece citriformis PCC 7424]|uniref:Restriction endonuclease n=1 Tax=Gloeothece citriformis (strain PCC 7424) TaxID=65393 RepID=B7K9N6_GLOC7|nr:TIR domain-containing protein [Gloeothece citriformis]ACK70004.1 restriction endonuclease [Gloeothece citriformis PCC 7424]